MSLRDSERRGSHCWLQAILRDEQINVCLTHSQTCAHPSGFTSTVLEAHTSANVIPPAVLDLKDSKSPCIEIGDQASDGCVVDGPLLLPKSWDGRMIVGSQYPGQGPTWSRRR